VSFFDTVPRLFIGAVGGAIADRFDRRRVLMITQTLGMVQAIIYWLAVYFKVQTAEIRQRLQPTA
jgi:nitrate/nitrite transporter NarK